MIHKLVQADPLSILFPTLYVCVSLCWSSLSSCLSCFDWPQLLQSRTRFGAAIYVKEKHLFGVGIALLSVGL